MAFQSYDTERNHFFLDLHGVLKRDAARVIRKRIEECRRYRIASLEVVYGTPDFFDGSIASELHGVVTGSADVETAALPREFVEDCERYSARVPKLTLGIRSVGARGACCECATFTPFPASREPDPWLRRLCETPFAPFKSVFSREEAAQFIGRGCRAEDLSSEQFTVADLEAFCRSWKPVEPPQTVDPVPESQPAPDREPSSEERWNTAWSEASQAFTAGDPKLSQARLQRCMELAGQSSDARFLARTLSALSILNSARGDSVQSRAFLESAAAAFEQSPEDTAGERVQIASILVDNLLRKGRLADAVSTLRETRAWLSAEDADHPAERVYVLSTEAALRTRLDDSEAASFLLVDAIGVLERHPELSAATLANLRMQLGFLEARRGLLRKALAHLTQAAEELELHPHSFEQSFYCHREIASIAGQLGYVKQVEETLKNLAMVPTTPASPADVARLGTLIELGNFYMERKRWAEAEATYLQARDQVVAAGSPTLCRFDIHQNLASVYTHTSRFADAEPEFAAAFAVSGELFPPSHPMTAQLHRNRSVFLTRAGRYVEARSDNERALRIYNECGAPASPDFSEAYFSQAMLFAMSSEWEESEYHLRLALSMKHEIYGEGHPATVNPLMKLGSVLFQQRAYTQARPMLTRAARIMEDYRMDPALLAEGHTYLALLYEATGQHKEAKKARDKAQWYSWSAKPGSAKQGKVN